MQKGIVSKLVFFLFCAVLILTLNACYGVSGGVHMGYSKHGPPSRGKKVVKPAPPAHAKAHGRRAKHVYHYYPDVQVYFDIHQKVYFYLQEQGWRMSGSLPPRIKLAGHVTIEMDTDKPYKKFKYHKVKYPPRHKKKKK